jgi:CHAT domain-containing protein
MSLIARFLITFLFVVLLFAVKAAAQRESVVLEVGKPVERLLKAGETHSYKINAAAGQFLHVVVEELYFDVVIAVISPEGKKLFEADAWAWREVGATEEIYVITETAGVYSLEVRGTRTTSAQSGYYSAKLNELRLETPADSLTLKAAALMTEGPPLLSKYKNAQDNSTKHFLKAAIEKYEEAISLFQAANNLGGEFAALREGALVRSNYESSLVKDLPKAIEDLKKALNLAERLGDRNRIGGILYWLARANYKLQNYAKAQELLDEAYLIYEALEKKFHLFSMQRVKADQYWSVSNYDKALEHYERAASIGETILDFPTLAFIWTSIGQTYARTGNSWKSLEYALKGEELFERFGIKSWVAAVCIDIGNSYLGLNNHNLALIYYEKALGIFQEIARQGGGIGSSLLSIGDVYLVQGKYDEARKKYQEALVDFERLNAPRVTAALDGIGLTYHKQGDFKRALEYFGRALDLKKSRPVDWSNISVPESLLRIASVQLDQGNYSHALDLAEQAANILRPLQDFSDISVRCPTVIGNAYLRLKQPEKARQAFEEAIANAEILFSRGGSLDDTRAYFGMVDLLGTEGKTAEAFTYAERTKSRTLLDVLQNGRIDITKAMSSEEREKETKLKREIVSLNSQISAEKDNARLDEQKKQLETKRREFEDFQTRLYALKPELKVQRGEMTPISLEESAKLLPADKSAFLEFVVGEDKSFLFAITKDAAQKVSLKVYPIEIKQKDLAEQTESFRSKLAKRDLDFARASQDLYKLLLKPAEAQLKNKTNLIIVPDSSLWNLPFQALQSAPNKYLVEQSSISYAPSSTALNEMAKKNKGKTFSDATLLAFGNPTVNKETSDRLKQIFMSDPLEPLPEAERLVNSLQKMYGASRAKVFVGAYAREEIAKSESSKFRVVQFAAHGVLNDFAPMYSHIVLAQKQGNPNEDGLLEAWEMKDLDLNADMVLLSACDTARGQVSAGEGVIGMSWALFIAGAPTTVASQWKVESSSTTEFMLEFHRQLLANKKISKAEALRRASLKLMKSAKYRHPSYWAPWILVGDGS